MEEGGQYYIKKYVDEFEKEPRIDTIVLAVPLSNFEAIHRTIFAKGVKLFDQGDLVAQKLKDYLKRHLQLII